MPNVPPIPTFIKSIDGGLVSLHHVSRIRLEQKPNGSQSFTWTLVAVIPAGSTDKACASRVTLFSSHHKANCQRALARISEALIASGNVLEAAL
mgnify:CR=1 FL=1